MCACTEPGGNGIDDVCVESGGQKWTKKYWITRTHATCVHGSMVGYREIFFSCTLVARTTRSEIHFSRLENQGGEVLLFVLARLIIIHTK